MSEANAGGCEDLLSDFLRPISYQQSNVNDTNNVVVQVASSALAVKVNPTEITNSSYSFDGSSVTSTTIIKDKWAAPRSWNKLN